MVGWFAQGETGIVRDYWSRGKFTPGLDSTQDVTLERAPTYDPSTNRVTFISRRKLDTGDDEDRVFELDTEYEMSYAYYRGSSSDRRRML